MLIAAVAAAFAGSGLGLLDRPFAELSVARDAAPAAVEDIPVGGPFRLVGSVHGMRAYEAPLPVRPRAMFFTTPPEGMTLRIGDKPFRYSANPADADIPDTWYFSADSVVVRVPPQAPPPRAGDVVITYPAAREREDALWRARSDAESDAAFVVRSAQVDDVTREGLYLPAPSTAGWDVTLPPDAALRFQVGVLPPEVADGTSSDGADVEVRVNGALAGTVRAAVGAFADARVPLATWGGQAVRLTIGTKDGDTLRDHVFVGAPTIYTPSEKPRRTVLVFLDTLRRDHLGLYGYTRGTSPSLDAWAESAVVFEDARSVAPWTLPSTRAALTGLQPEHWGNAPTLPQRLAAQGWATAAYVGNVYLSSNFEMADGWGEHGCINWPYARFEVDRTLEFFARHPDQDALVMVHFMDMHLPYKEPRAYRGIYEGEQPPGLYEGFNRNSLLMASRGNQDAIRKYLIARYDQNLRYVDDQLARLFREVGDDATVVVFADHGEEFFDHGDLEHGHTLYDELLRIPLLVKAPGLAPRRVPTPVSLLDVTPTVLDLLGTPDESLAGKSLAKLARGEADPALERRPLAFGRPLYGNAAWGSLAGGMKYISTGGEEHIFDVRRDASELSDIRADRDPRPLRDAMAASLDREVVVAYRVAPRGRAGGLISVELHVPGGIREAWVGDDPTMKSVATIERLDDATIIATFEASRGFHREVFVVPNQDAVAIAPTVTVRIARPGLDPVALSPDLFDGEGRALAQIRSQGRTVEVTYTAIPLPAGNTVVGIDEEQRSALEMLGYLDPADNPSADERDEAPAAPPADAPTGKSAPDPWKAPDPALLEKITEDVAKKRGRAPGAP